MTTQRKRSIHRRIDTALLAWFRNNARPLPWRRSRDPYRIWISEVMLQQTQVATVIPYFKRFLKKFPTLSKLARTDEQAVLRLWEGLGYYRRARSLWQAARQLRDGGFTTVPDDPEIVRALPGFGRYTTNAVLSQAYDRRLPILEANSQRVLCRLMGIDQDPKSPAVQRALWQHAEALLPATSVGDFNQAMMELGALVCTPANPKCNGCPLRAHCHARTHGRQHDIPLRVKAPQTVAVAEVAVIVRKGDQLLLVQRGDEGRWARMWEFPHVECEPRELANAAATQLLKTLGITAQINSVIATIRHTVTRFNITLTCLGARYRRGSLPANARWVRPEELHAFPLSTPQRRLASLMTVGDDPCALRAKPPSERRTDA